MPTFSIANHALQFGSNAPTVSIYGTDISGYITYQMSGSFLGFEPAAKYFALKIIFNATYAVPPTSVTLTPANSYTEQVLASNLSIGFYVDGGVQPGDVSSDIQTSYFNISGTSTTETILGPGVLAWYYEVSTGADIDTGGGGGGGGTVTSISTQAPLSGGTITTTGTISIPKANVSTDGYLSQTDWTTFNNKLTSAVTSVATSGPLTGGTITTTGTLGITKATTSTDGYLSSADWNTFNSKLSAAVTSVATNSTLSGGTITSTGTLSINLANANTWSAKQTFTGHIAVDGYTVDFSAGAVTNQVLQFNGTSFVAATIASGGTIATTYNAGSTSTDTTALIRSSHGGPIIAKANAASTGSLFKVLDSSSGVIADFNDSNDTVIMGAHFQKATLGSATWIGGTTNGFNSSLTIGGPIRSAFADGTQIRFTDYIAGGSFSIQYFVNGSQYATMAEYGGGPGAGINFYPTANGFLGSLNGGDSSWSSIAAHAYTMTEGAGLTSASTISIAQTAHSVSGTATIDTIDLSGMPEGSAFQGFIVLRPTGLWKLTTGGNINSSVVAVVGRPVILFCYQGTCYPIAYGAAVDKQNTFTKAQNVASFALTDAASIATDATQSNVFTVTLTATGRTLADPSGLVSGGTYLWVIRQDSGGSKTITTYGSMFKFPGGTLPTLTTTGSAVDMISAVYDGTQLNCVFQADFR